MTSKVTPMAHKKSSKQSRKSTTDAEPTIIIEDSFKRNKDSNVDPWGPKPEITAPLVTANNKRLRRGLAFIVYPLIVSAVVGIILIVVSSQIDNVISLLGGLFLLVGFIIVVPVLSCLYCMRQAEAMDKEEHYAIRIEGELWNRYLTYFFAKNNRPKYFYSCMLAPEKRLNELRQRGFGYIIISSSGFMIDEIYYISYGTFAVYNTEILSTTNDNGIQDTTLRMFITNRTHQAKHGAMVKFHADIFLPPQLSPETLTKIIKFIASKRGTITVVIEV